MLYCSKKGLSLLLAVSLPVAAVAQDFYGRGYTIIAPEQGSNDLTAIVYRDLPAGNVKGALEILLSGTGWQLADAFAADPMIFRLYNQQLPEQKRKLGPISLNEALVWIGGPAWRLVVDPVNKLVSYEVKGPYRESRRVIPPVAVPNDSNSLLTHTSSVDTEELETVNIKSTETITLAQDSAINVNAVSPAASVESGNTDILRISIPPKTYSQNHTDWNSLKYSVKKGAVK